MGLVTSPAIRVSDHFALSLGARYDLQTFTTKGLRSNPLWPDAGRVPYNTANVGPRVGLAYSVGKERPLVIRAGFGLFFTVAFRRSTLPRFSAITGWWEISFCLITIISLITRHFPNTPTRW